MYNGQPLYADCGTLRGEESDPSCIFLSAGEARLSVDVFSSTDGERAEKDTLRES